MILAREHTLLAAFFQLIQHLSGILSQSLVFTSEKPMGRETPIRKLYDAHVEGNREKFNKYYLPSFKRLTMLCLGLLKDEGLAENVASESLIKLLEQESPEEIRDIDKWISTVAKRKCLTLLSTMKRRRDIRENISGSFEKQQQPEGDQQLRQQEMEKLIREALSERDHKIWQWHLRGFRNDEISEKMEIPEKTIANRKTEVRKILQNVLRDYNK